MQMLGQARFLAGDADVGWYLFTGGFGRYHGSNSRQTNNRKEAIQTVGLEKTDGIKVASSQQGEAGSVPKKYDACVSQQQQQRRTGPVKQRET